MNLLQVKIKRKTCHLFFRCIDTIFHQGCVGTTVTVGYGFPIVLYSRKTSFAHLSLHPRLWKYILYGASSILFRKLLLKKLIECCWDLSNAKERKFQLVYRNIHCDERPWKRVPAGDEYKACLSTLSPVSVAESPIFGLFYLREIVSLPRDFASLQNFE